MPKEHFQDKIEYLLSIALQKCGNISDAQDLTQETILSALLYLEKGGRIENPRAYLSAILNRKYYDMLRKKYRLPTVTIGEDFEIADDTDFEQELLKTEEAENIRREVAYLANSYRSVIVKHYFHNKSVNEIADELNIPVGTVKSRLNIGRKQVKKGFDTMEKYSENSYMPQHLAVSNSGSFGINEEPMSLTRGDTLAQNLLILAYDKPLTVSELSKAIGVATAYVEPVVKKLVDGELMKQMGNGKVYTDFIIYQPDDWVKYINEAETFAEKHIDKFIGPFTKAVKELKKTDFYSERLERFMLIQIAESGLYNTMESVREKPQIFPQRPNGGRWIAFATVYPENYVAPKEYRGKEEYRLSGRRCTTVANYLDASMLKIYNYESTLDKYSHLKHYGYGFNAIKDVELNMLKFFYLLKKNIKPESVAFDTRIIKSIPILEERGFITTQNGTPELLVPVLTREEEKSFFEICKKAHTAFGDSIREPLADYCRTHQKTIPPHLKSVPDQKLTLPYEPCTMMFVYETIRRGAHKRDLGFTCPETIVVFD